MRFSAKRVVGRRTIMILRVISRRTFTFILLSLAMPLRRAAYSNPNHCVFLPALWAMTFQPSPEIRFADTTKSKYILKSFPHEVTFVSNGVMSGTVVHDWDAQYKPIIRRHYRSQPFFALELTATDPVASRYLPTLSMS
ncbi:hypothetical protein FPV67DRAFT_506894 [Lyophyllum atratum]|nr:hypothetical protein FPV67DRAFT_506894 [Lyophyllum atratum]